MTRNIEELTKKHEADMQKLEDKLDEHMNRTEGKWEEIMDAVREISMSMKMNLENNDKRVKSVEETVVELKGTEKATTPYCSDLGVLGLSPIQKADQKEVGSSTSIQPTASNHGYNFNMPKIDFPIFEGVGPRECVRKAHWYFVMHKTPDHLRLEIAQMYLKGRADTLFSGFTVDKPNTDWRHFTEELCLRFAENCGEDVIGALCKIKQKGNIIEYMEIFEELKAQCMMALPNLPENYYVAVFTSSLKEEIKATIKMFKPNTLSKTFELA